MCCYTICCCIKDFMSFMALCYNAHPVIHLLASFAGTRITSRISALFALAISKQSRKRSTILGKTIDLFKRIYNVGIYKQSCPQSRIFDKTRKRESLCIRCCFRFHVQSLSQSFIHRVHRTALWSSIGLYFVLIYSKNKQYSFVDLNRNELIRDWLGCSEEWLSQMINDSHSQSLGDSPLTDWHWVSHSVWVWLTNCECWVSESLHWLSHELLSKWVTHLMMMDSWMSPSGVTWHLQSLGHPLIKLILIEWVSHSHSHTHSYWVR